MTKKKKRKKSRSCTNIFDSQSKYKFKSKNDAKRAIAALKRKEYTHRLDIYPCKWCTDEAEKIRQQLADKKKRE